MSTGVTVRRVALLPLLAVLALATGCDRSTSVAGKGAPDTGGRLPAEATRLPNFCEELPHSPAQPIIAGIKATREHSDDGDGPQESCTWERDGDHGIVALRVSVHARVLTSTDAAKEAVQSQPGEPVDLSPQVEQATERVVLDPKIPGIVTITIKARRANVVIDVEYVVLGEAPTRAKGKAGAVTQAAFDAVGFH